LASTEIITILFTDLVSSTELSSRLGPEASDELRQTHFLLLRHAIAVTDGTEVKNLGDGLMVVFSSVSRALACAIGMQQAIEVHNRLAPEALCVRIGVSMGEATTEDGDYFGEPVVEAARLCAAAAAGGSPEGAGGRADPPAIAGRGCGRTVGGPAPVRRTAHPDTGRYRSQRSIVDLPGGALAIPPGRSGRRVVRSPGRAWR
jgi:hypothetical protein